MNNPSMDQWKRMSNASSAEGNGGNTGNASGGGMALGMNPTQGQAQFVGNMDASNNMMMMNANSMNLLASLNANMNSFGNDVNGNTNFFGNGVSSNNSNNSGILASYPLQLQGGQATNNMMNNGFILTNNNGGSVSTNGPSQQTNANTVTVFQVKTGESVAPYLPGGRQQPQQTGAQNMASFNMGHNGGNSSEEMARSSSESMLHQMDGMGPFGLNHGAGPLHHRQLDKLDINNQGFGFNNAATNFSPSGGGGGGNNNNNDNNRRRSEPPLNMLSQVFDATHGSNTNAIPGWSSPSLGARRPNAAPRDLMLDLHNLEPEKVFHDLADPTGGPPNQGHSQRRDQWTRNDEKTRTGGGKVKRSRSIDPLEMFRRVDDENHPFPQAHDGMSREEQQRLQSSGIHSLERPKRRRSLPLLSQDMFGDAPDQQGSQRNNCTSDESFSQANPSLPEGPQEKNNVNLIDMLLGIENGASNVQTDAQIKPSAAVALQPQRLPLNSQQAGDQNTLIQMQSALMGQQQPPSNSGSIIPASNQLNPKPMGQLGPTAPQSQLTSNSNLGMTQQQLPPNNAFMGNLNSVANRMMPENQQSGNPFAGNPNTAANIIMPSNQQVGNPFGNPASKDGSSQAPPPLSINNSDDLTLVLSAVKETQTNLRTLQPLVMQLGDPLAMEELASAFKITASSSQFVLSSDLPSAYSTLNDAWTKIKMLEDRLARGQSQPTPPQPFLNMGNFINFQGNNGVMKQQMMVSPQAALQNQILQNQILGTVSKMESMGMGPSNPPPGDPSVPLSNNTYIPDHGKKRRGKAGADADVRPVAPSSGGIKPPVEDVQKSKPPPPASKGKPKAGKRESRSPSPDIDVGELKELPPQDKHDPEIIMSRLKGFMDRTQISQKKLQKWDKKNGLPKSHSQTMVNSSRSREQLQKGVILKKWNGSPLIDPETAAKTTSDEETTPPEQADSPQEGGEKPEEAPSSQEELKATPEQTPSSREEQEEGTKGEQTNVDADNAEDDSGPAESEESNGGPAPSKTTDGAESHYQKKDGDPKPEAQ